jgi:hypothetical protein
LLLFDDGVSLFLFFDEAQKRKIHGASHERNRVSEWECILAEQVMRNVSELNTLPHLLLYIDR